MEQTLIVYTIIVLAIAYSIFAVIKNIRKKDTSACGGCDGCDIKKEITKNVRNTDVKNPATCGHSSSASIPLKK